MVKGELNCFDTDDIGNLRIYLDLCSSTKNAEILHCLKSVCIQSCSGLHFPIFGLNTERYSVSLHIQSKCRKTRTKITPNNSYYRHLLGNVEVANDGGELTRKINQKEKSDVSEQSVDVHSVTNAGKSNSSILSISYVSMIFLVDCCEIT